MASFRAGTGMHDGENPFRGKLETHIDGASVTRRLKDGSLDAIVIDLRKPKEFAEGHVPGAINVALKDVVEFARGQPPDQAYITACYHIGCMLSTKAAMLLWDAGHTRVRELLGGWETWQQKGYPIERAEMAEQTA
jgi:rhodanese-related sulfurtransferase